MKTFTCEQRSEEWFELHIGRVTASYMSDVMDFRTTGDKGPGSMRNAYMGKKIAETLTNQLSMLGYVNAAMQWGNDNEDGARRAYVLASGNFVDCIGFGIHPEIERFGASPDGLIGDDGMVELKCPETSTHIKWMDAGDVPVEHRPQMYAQMAVFGRQWCDFQSYDPRLGKRYERFSKRLVRDEAMIKVVEDAARKFLSDMDAMIERMEQLNPPVDEPVREQAEIEDGITQDDIDWITKQQQEA